MPAQAGIDRADATSAREAITVGMKPLCAPDTLLLIAFRHSIAEPNVEAAFERILEIAGGKLEPRSFHDALASCQREGLIREPVRLPEGSLQCHWHLELTPKGAETVRALLRERGMTADRLLDHLRQHG